MLCKIVFWEVFKKVYKTIKESISSNIANLFYSKTSWRAFDPLKGARRRLQVHSKNTWELKALKHLNDLLALVHSKDTWTLQHWRHICTWPLRHLDTLALKGYLGTQILRHEGTVYMKAFYMYIKVLFLQIGWKQVKI